MQVVLLTFIPNDPLAKSLVPTPDTLWSSTPELLVSEGIMFLPEDVTMIPMNWINIATWAL
jgi:hypothetical protein